MNTDLDNKIIVTIALQMHGSVFTFDLTNETSQIFENVRLLCGAGGFNSYESNFINELVLVKRLRNYFAHNIDESTNTFDMLKESKKGLLFGNVTFDKILSTTTADANLLNYLSYTTYLEGIYLISIHKGRELVYPQNPNDILNLIYVTDLSKLTEIFKTTMPNIESLSTVFPNIKNYIDEENNIQKSDLPENEKNEKIDENKKNLLTILNKWNLTLDKSKKKIEMIKLSILVELVKTLISQDCIINLLDYSCSNPSRFIPKDQNNSSKYALPYDIEQGIPNTKLGGNQKHRKYRKHTKSKTHKKSRKSRKSKTHKKSRTLQKRNRNRK